MKHISALLFLMLLFAPGWAQQSKPTTAKIPGGGTPPAQVAPLNHYTHVVDSITQPLDRAGITSSILYDRVMPLAGLHAFNSAGLDTSSAQHFRQAYLEMYTASYNPGNRTRPAYVRERADFLTRRDSVPLAVFDAAFHLLDTLAVQDNLISQQNGLLYDVAGRSRSPYVAKEVVLASPLADTVVSGTRFYLSPELTFSTRGRAVSSLLVDFGNQQGLVPCLPGQAVSVSYGASGPKVLHFLVQFTDGSQAQALARLYVRYAPVNKTPVVTPSSPAGIPLPLVNSIQVVTAKVPFTNYTPVLSGPLPTNLVTLSLYGVGEALVVLNDEASQAEYSGSSSAYKLRRPVIFVDGIDANDERQLFFNTEKETSIYNELSAQGILAELDRQNRDLIILNFPKSQRQKVGGGWTDFDVDGGTDYIERNATVLVQLLADLKPRLASPTEKFTIIGPSMGGLVSRYALAYMEKQQQQGAAVPQGATADYWNHNTALYVSLDSPHQGANIPLGDQEFLRYYQGISEVAEKNLNENLNSVASRQMLVHHHLAGSEAPAGAPVFRNRFMLALRDNGLPNSLGYPVNLRRVALANGRQDGISRPGSSTCDYALQMDIFLRSRGQRGRKRTFFLGFNITDSFSSANIYFSPSPNDRCKVFEGNINLFGSAYSGYTTPIRRRTFVRSNAAGSYDIAPGGSYDAQEQLRSQTEEGDNREPYDAVFRTVIPEHSFIPTVSALGFQYQSMNTYQNTSSLPNPYTNLLNRDLVCTGEIPFDDYYAPAHGNTYHVQPDNGGLFFLGRELAFLTKPPVLNALPAAVCPNSFARFSVQECAPPRAGQPGLTYNWIAGTGLHFLVNGQPVQQLVGVAGQQDVYADQNFTGASTLTVTATRTGYQESTPVTQSVYVGPATLQPTSNTGEDPVCRGANVLFTAEVNNVTINSLQWEIHGGFTGNTVTYYNGVREVDYQLKFSDKRVYAVLRGTDACTGAAIAPVQLNVNVDLYCGNGEVSIYPNPANEQVEVTTINNTQPRNTGNEESESSNSGNDAFSLTVHDGRGRPLREASTTTGRIQLDTRSLAPGLYHVQIRRGSRVINRQLSIQR
jgi:Secretion system C-terminal sorting domain/PGAP1-like protein